MDPPLVLVIFGLIATGKTTLARAMGQNQGWPVIHSDVVRKTLAGLSPTRRVPENFGAGIYTEEFSQRTYQEMLRQARQYLENGQSVILDGSYKRARARLRVRQLAQECGALAAFIYCSCSTAEVQRRLDQRRQNLQAISNGRAELLTAQQQDFDPLDDLKDCLLLHVDTGRPLATVLRELEDFLPTRWEKKGGCNGPRGDHCPGKKTGPG
jgi:predicted kinase